MVGRRQAGAKETKAYGQRVFNRLKKEISGFDCSYRTVATYYSVKREEIFSGLKDGYLPLEHKPGEVQLTLEQQIFMRMVCISQKIFRGIISLQQQRLHTTVLWRKYGMLVRRIMQYLDT